MPPKESLRLLLIGMFALTSLIFLVVASGAMLRTPFYLPVSRTSLAGTHPREDCHCLFSGSVLRDDTIRRNPPYLIAFHGQGDFSKSSAYRTAYAGYQCSYETVTAVLYIHSGNRLDAIYTRHIFSSVSIGFLYKPLKGRIRFRPVPSYNFLEGYPVRFPHYRTAEQSRIFHAPASLPPKGKPSYYFHRYLWKGLATFRKPVTKHKCRFSLFLPVHNLIRLPPGKGCYFRGQKCLRGLNGQ